MLKIWPARSAKQPDVAVIADIDQIIGSPIAFRFQGRIFKVKPVSVESFLQIADSLNKIQGLLQKRAGGEDISDDFVYDSYLGFIHPLCPEITLKDIKTMEIPQLYAVVELIIGHLTGRVKPEIPFDHSKKKVMVH